jgi:hypothetical protein
MVAVSSAVELRKPKQACIKEGAGEATGRAVIDEPRGRRTPVSCWCILNSAKLNCMQSNLYAISS